MSDEHLPDHPILARCKGCGMVMPEEEAMATCEPYYPRIGVLSTLLVLIRGHRPKTTAYLLNRHKHPCKHCGERSWEDVDPTP